MENSAGGDRKRLTILSVAFPLFTVGRGEGGGAEEILGLIDAGLTRAGHRSIVIAASRSKVRGNLMETPAANVEVSDEIRKEAQRIQRHAIDDVLAREHVDLIHFHGLDFLSYRPLDSVIPQLATLHLPIAWYPSDLFTQPGLAMNFVSLSQAASDPERHSLPVICNGIELTYFSVSPKNGYLTWLGRICPEKGPHIALRVAHRTGMPLILAGPLHPFAAHHTYYVEQVEPLLDTTRTYIGPVYAEARSRLLAGSCCLLLPSFAAETSSLVAMEALASGTPVVAFRAGALSEIVDDRVTGFLVNSEDEMVEAITSVQDLSGDVCRCIAEQRFSAARMVSQYIALYNELITS